MQLALLESVFKCAHGDSRENNSSTLPSAWVASILTGSFQKLKRSSFISNYYDYVSLNSS